MATLTVNDIVQTGLNTGSVYGAAAGGGDEMPNTGREFIHVKNGGGSAITVTITSTATHSGLTVQDPVVSVAAGGEQMIGPFPQGVYNNANARVSISYSGVTSVTLAAFKLPE
jgi:hypothetical protein